MHQQSGWTATPFWLIGAPPLPSPPFLCQMPFPIYPALGQAPNVLAWLLCTMIFQNYSHNLHWWQWHIDVVIKHPSFVWKVATEMQLSSLPWLWPITGHSVLLNWVRWGEWYANTYPMLTDLIKVDRNVCRASSDMLLICFSIVPHLHHTTKWSQLRLQ